MKLALVPQNLSFPDLAESILETCWRKAPFFDKLSHEELRVGMLVDATLLFRLGLLIKLTLPLLAFFFAVKGLSKELQFPFIHRIDQLLWPLTGFKCFENVVLKFISKKHLVLSWKQIWFLFEGIFQALMIFYVRRHWIDGGKPLLKMLAPKATQSFTYS